MLEHAGLVYGLLKDLYKKIKDSKEWNEERKLIDRDYLNKSRLEKKLSDSGYKIFWSRPERVESRKLDGYDYMYEIDEKKKTKYRIERKDGTVLIGRKL